MKKLILSLVLVASTSVFAATTFTTNLATTAGFIIPGSQAGSVLSYVLLSSDSTHTGSALLFDSPGNWTTQTNAAYSYNSVYATNYITTWTNYYGATNSITNLALVTVSNYTAAANVSLTPKLSLSIGTNASAQYTGLNIEFRSGIVVTNTSGGTIGLTIGYVQ
jgi:hypothetical protein